MELINMESKDSSAPDDISDLLIYDVHKGFTQHIAINNDEDFALEETEFCPQEIFLVAEEAAADGKSCKEKDDEFISWVTRGRTSIKYNPEWEKDPTLSTWLSASPLDKSVAFCTVCAVQLHGCKTDIRRHRERASHIKKLRRAERLKLKENGNSKRSQSYSTLDENTSFPKILTKISRKEERKKARQRNSRVENQSKFRPEWVHFKSLKDWLVVSPYSEERGYCQMCLVELKGCRSDIEKHGKSKKHILRFSIYSKTLTLPEEEIPPDNLSVNSINDATPPSPEMEDHIETSEVDQREDSPCPPYTPYTPYTASYSLHSPFINETMKKWHSRGSEINPWNLMYPVYITNKLKGSYPVKEFLEIKKYGLHDLRDLLAPYIDCGLKSILISYEAFGETMRDEDTTTEEAHMLGAIKILKGEFPELTIACRLYPEKLSPSSKCFSDEDEEKVSACIAELTAKQAINYAAAGADIILPPNSVAGEIKAIKSKLFRERMLAKVSVFSCSVVFASAFLDTDKKSSTQQEDIEEKQRLHSMTPDRALQCVERDLNEGANMVMIEPGYSYLDIVYKIRRKFPRHPLVVLQGPSEYEMLQCAADNKVIDLEDVLLETLVSIRRAGAEVIVSYHTPLVLQWIRRKEIIFQSFQS